MPHTTLSDTVRRNRLSSILAYARDLFREVNPVPYEELDRLGRQLGCILIEEDRIPAIVANAGTDLILPLICKLDTYGLALDGRNVVNNPESSCHL